MNDLPPPSVVVPVNVSVNLPSWKPTPDPPRRRERDLCVEPATSWPPVELDVPVVRLTQAVYARIMKVHAEVPPEAGGIILGPEGSDLVTTFHRDENGFGTSVTFTLDAKGLNAKLRVYKDAGLEMMGVVHSHPRGVKTPSPADLDYAAKLLTNPKNEGTEELLMPIYCSGILYPYVIRRDNPRSCLQAQLILV